VKYRKWTKIVSMIILAAIVLWDVFVMVTDGADSSISSMLIEMSYQYPIMPFSIGVVCGHLFWRMPITEALKKILGGRK